MPAPLDLAFDPERWIPVPVSFADTPWPDAGAWADAVARAASSGQPAEDELRARIDEAARLVASFPTEGVAVRLWHYPTDAPPTGFVDVSLVERPPGEEALPDLLPDGGFTVSEPVVERIETAHLDDAVRRLSLNAALADGREEPGLLAKAEWIGVAGEMLVYLVSADHDVAALQSRLGDIDRVFAGIDPDALRREESSRDE